MPTTENKLQAGLSGTERLDMADPGMEPWDPYNCPTCRSGVIMYPEAIVSDVVSVEL